MARMGHNSRDRQFEQALRRRAKEVSALDARGQALHLAVDGARGFPEWSLIYRVLDRLQTERGIGRMYAVSYTKAANYACGWAESRGCPHKRLTIREALQAGVHGMVVFGPDVRPAEEVARHAGVIVWKVVQRPYHPKSGEPG